MNNKCDCSSFQTFWNDVYPECRISPELQQAADSGGAEVSGGDVQGSAEIKVAAGGIHFWNIANMERAPCCVILYVPE